MEAHHHMPGLPSHIAPNESKCQKLASRRSGRRPARRRTRRVFPALVALTLLAILSWSGIIGRSDDALSTKDDGHGSFSSRHLLEKPAWEQCDFEQDHGAGGFTILYIILVLDIFLGIAILCDDFFVPSLEGISEALNLSEDVAGATFMAAGSSAPELFTSLTGIAVESDIGVGTIVGSAVFNILVIIALSAALAGKVLQLDWRVLYRDSIFYGLSIIVFIIFVWDGYIEAYEASILLILYFLYLVVMKFNKHVLDALGYTWMRCCGANQVAPITTETMDDAPHKKVHVTNEVIVKVGNNRANSSGSAKEGRTDTHSDQESERSALGGRSNSSSQLNLLGSRLNVLSCKKSEMFRSTPNLGDIDIRDAGTRSRNSSLGRFHHFERGSVLNLLSHRNSMATSHPDIKLQGKPDSAKSAQMSPEKDGKEEDMEASLKQLGCSTRLCFPCNDTSGRPELGSNKDGQSTFLNYLSFGWSWFIYAAAAPYVWAFTNTIPDGKVYYKTAFFLSIVWIVAMSFAMVTIVIRMGCIIGVDDYVMGLVVVAVGTSVPDALSSVLVARDGFGDMAVSNAIGSNIFDIDLGLGLPFLIKIIWKRSRLDILSKEMRANPPSLLPHAKFGFILFGILLMTMGIFTYTKFRLNRVIGVSFFFVYVVFIIYALVQELSCHGDC